MTRRLDLRDASGFTLVEMVVASALGVLILSVGAGILISVLRTQHVTGDLAGASTSGQLISSSIEEGVRNAAPGPAPSDSPVLTDDGVLSSVDADGQLLRARVALGTTGGKITWQCQAWYYSPATQTISMARANAQIDDPGGFSMVGGHVTPNVPQAGVSWTLLGSNITPADGTTLVFNFFNGQLNLNFKVTNGSTSLVLVPNVIIPRKIAASGDGPDQCYPLPTPTPTPSP